jgi:alkylation response protein AidB-like acyl-CoA dehydrogenase
MPFVLTEEEETIRKTARDLLRERAPVSHFRKLRDAADPVGFSRELWNELASLGFAGLPIPEANGGSGMGLGPLALVLEECGRSLTPTPFLSTTVLGASALSLSGLAAQKDELLGPVASGERILSLAHDEGTRHRRAPSRTTLVREGTSLILSGEKTFVLDGHVSNALVVSARSGDGVSLVIVPARADGVEIARRTFVDHRNASTITFRGVRLPEAALLGPMGGAADTLSTVLDRGIVALCAEMLGGALEAFDRTVSYLKERRQFGVPIGSFQALKHRAAWMFCDLELCKSIVREAACAADEGRPDFPLLAAAAKAKLTDTSLQVANEAVQMHGGVGVTDELDIGFFLKRARVTEATFGDAAFHRDRFATLSGY